MRLFRVIASGLATLVALCGCSGTSHHDGHPAVGTVRVSSVLVWEHPDAAGQMETHRDAMSGYTVTATSDRGVRATADIDGLGISILRVPAGAYTITNSLSDACRPYRLTVRPGAETTIKLSCAAP